MAAGATIVASFSIYPKFVNFSSATHSSISLTTLNFPHTKTISPKPQLFNSLHCLPSISFHEFLLTQKIIEVDEDADEEEDEEVDEEDEEEEQPRRLFDINTYDL
ncbi:RNA-binding protein CP33, chloroplastic [Trifolium repens]|nr:RNA-binding protein CP33, chloroplastic [Trifolium repens]